MRRTPETTILTLAYIAFSVLGCLYILFSLFAGHGHFGEDAGHDGGPDAAHEATSHVDDGLDGHGHVSASAAGHAAASFHFPLFSPLALATLFAAVGAYGLIALYGVAQIKIRKDEASLHAAAERFLGKEPEEIAKIALETVQGHLRGILGTLSVEDIYKNRDQFAQKVQEISTGDLGNMGLGIDSFTIRDIRDKHGYLDALGRPRIAEVKRTAAIAEAVAAKESAIAQADAERETRERQAEAQRLAQEAEAKRDAAVAEANADKQRRQREADAASTRAAEIANFQAQQAIAEQQAIANRKKAEAEMAYEIQKKTQEIQVQEQEIQRREKELDATIKRQADAKRYEVETQAAAEKNRRSTIAEGEKLRGFAAAEVQARQGQAEADAEKARGLAAAEIRQAQGLAEALGMEKKAEAWQKYNEAAVLQILAPLLPEIARAVAEPLSKVDRITMVNTGANGDIGVSKVTAEVAKVIAQVPPVLESLTGLKFEQLLERLRPAPAVPRPLPELKPEK